MIMPTIAPGRKIIPVVLVAFYEGDEGALKRDPQDGRYGLAARGPEGEGGLDLGPLFGHIVADTGHRQAGGVHGVSDHHAAEGDQVARRRGYDPEREQQPQGRHGRHPNGDSRHEKYPRHVPGPTRRGPGGEEDHTGQQQHDHPEAVEPEDVIYDVPDRGELHKGADHGDTDVLLQAQPP
jgi:hypothetical protein